MTCVGTDTLAYIDPSINPVYSASNVDGYSFKINGTSGSNPLTSKVGDGVTFINSSATYTASGNYLESIKDSSGNTVNSNFNISY